MKFSTENGTEIEMYDHISQIPRYVFHRMRKYAIQAASLEQDLKSQVVEVSHWVQRGKREEALTALENIIMSIYSVEQDHSFADQEWGALITKVNGEPFEWSEAAVKALVLDSQITDEMLTMTLEDVKKKLNEQLAVAFPKRHGNIAFTIEQNALMIRYARARIKQAQSPSKESEKEVTQAFNDLMDARPPMRLSPRHPESMIIEMDKSDETLSFSLMGNGVNHPEQMSVFQLECAIENLSRKNENTKPGQPADMV